MNKKIGACFFLILIELGLSCGKYRNNCNPPFFKRNFCGLALENGKFNSLNASNIDSVAAIDYVLLLSIETNEVCSRPFRLKSGQLYATPPCDPEIQYLQAIQAISISDVMGYDDALVIPDSVTDRFSLQIHGSRLQDLDTSNSITGLNSYIGGYNFIDVDKMEELSLKIKTFPQSPKWHQFKVKVYLSDSRILEHTSDSIYLY